MKLSAALQNLALGLPTAALVLCLFCDRAAAGQTYLAAPPGDFWQSAGFITLPSLIVLAIVAAIPGIPPKLPSKDEE